MTSTYTAYVASCGKIALEEAFLLPGYESLIPMKNYMAPGAIEPALKRLFDVDGRLEDMDRYGIELEVLSLCAPGLQAEPDPVRGAELTRRANNGLAEIISRHPTRFAGFASLAMHDTDCACRELQRCVDELGFIGVILNGFQNVGDSETAAYLDEARFRDFWREVERLDVPLYLHPRDPLESQRRILDGHPEMLAATWAFTPETAGHALRLILSGLFDDCPRLQVILGHLGEGLPFLMSRIERRVVKYVHELMKRPLQHSPSYYFRSNLNFTTSGHFDTHALFNTFAAVGPDRVLFAIDYPFETVSDAVDWFDEAPINPNDKQKVAFSNASRLFKRMPTARYIGPHPQAK